MALIGIHRTAGKAFRPAVIAGKEYRLRPLQLDDYAEMEARIVAARPDPFEVAAKSISKVPQPMQQAVWDAAMRDARTSRKATLDELVSWGCSEAGFAFTFWRCARKDHPEVETEAKAREILNQATPEELASVVVALKVGSGETELKNSDGPEEAGAPGPAEAASSPAGPSSTEASPNATDGRPASSVA
jgi:hypothetical protein